MINNDKIKYRHILLWMTSGLFCFSFAALFIGRYSVSIEEFTCVITSSLPTDNYIAEVIYYVRLPRIILSVIVGASLASSGTALQGVLQNPLAGPEVLGTSSGAGFGAAMGLLLFPDNLLLTSLTAFVSGIVSMLFVLLLAGRKTSSIMSIILSGIIVSSIFMALISLVKYVADTDNTLPAITFWLMGSFAQADFLQVETVILPTLSCIGVLLLFRWKLNILSLGDEDAAMMGVNPRRLRILLIVISTLLISVSVTVAGVIGWVGLVIPHICRRLVGANHGYVMPLSIVAGAFFMLLIDTIARSISSAEIPIGILTALIGAPIFTAIFIMKRKRQR